MNGHETMGSPERVLITGGAGFIGSHLARLHLDRGDTVEVVDDLSTGTRENLPPDGHPGFDFVEADLVGWPGLPGSVERADRIYHLAAVVGMFRVLREPRRVAEVNVLGTERLLRLAGERGRRPRVLFASTSEVYGPGPSRTLAEGDPLIVHGSESVQWRYALGKLAGEVLSTAWSEAGLPVTVARLFNTVGRGQTGRYGMVLPRFVEQALAGAPITVFGDGHQTRSFCDVRDTVCALAGLLDEPATAGRIVNVGHDRPMTILGLARMIRRRLGSESEIVHVDLERAYMEGFVEIRHRRPSIERLREMTGFEPRHSIEETIDEVVAERATPSGD